MFRGYNHKELYKICEEEDEEVVCMSSPLTNLSEVIQVMRSSWVSCINVEAGENMFVILPSITDNYFTLEEDYSVDEEEGQQVRSDLISFTQLGRNISMLDRRNNKGKTFLISVSPDQLTDRLRSLVEIIQNNSISMVDLT